MNTRSVEQEFKLSDTEFQRLRRLVHEHTGIALSEAKRDLVYGRLSRCLRRLNLHTFTEYCALIETEQPGELQQLINAITTNLTAFFRENYHFEQLATQVLPYSVGVRSTSRRLRLWSAGCSTGEEPYSMAVVLRESLHQLAEWDIKLLATDIDSTVVATAATGVYPADRFKGVSAERIQRWFPQSLVRAEEREAAAELKELITFKQLNLLDPWPMKGPFDVIFCRNVVIYFDKDTQRYLFERMAEMQAPGGWLFIGHSENLFNVTTRYKLVGRTVYRRVE